jgi:small GTP-binding protein
MAQSGYKVVILGSSGVGKTAILQRLVDGTFIEETASTVGVEFKTFMLPLEGQTSPVRLNIWDTAGQERFRAVSLAYFRNAVGAILVFAIDDAPSFAALDSWLAELHRQASPNCIVVLVGNKADNDGNREVTVSQAEDFATRHDLHFFETSARKGTGVTEAFVRLAMKIVEKVKAGEIQESTAAPIRPPVARPERDKEPKGCHC